MSKEEINKEKEGVAGDITIGCGFNSHPRLQNKPEFGISNQQSTRLFVVIHSILLPKDLCM